MSTKGEASHKQDVQAALVNLTRQQLDGAASARSFLSREAELDQDEPLDNTAMSQSDTANDLADSYENAVAKARQDVLVAEALDMSPTDVVRPGAVISFGGQSYVVGLAAEQFEVDGTSYEGISLGSPVYALIEGKRAGDRFTYNGVDHVLDDVK